jgi:hypothetical protein
MTVDLSKAAQRDGREYLRGALAPHNRIDSDYGVAARKRVFFKRGFNLVSTLDVYINDR